MKADVSTLNHGPAFALFCNAMTHTLSNLPKIEHASEDSQLHACDGGNAPSCSAGTQQCSSTVGGTDSFISVQETSLATVAGFFPRIDTGLLAPQSLMCEPRLPFNLCDASCGAMPCTCLPTSASVKLSSVHCWCISLYPIDVMAPSRTGESDATVPSAASWCVATRWPVHRL